MTDRSDKDTPRHAGWILFTMILGSSLAFIDGTVVNVALPFLQEDLNASATGVQWVVQAYSLFLAALILVGGSLGDRLGRKKVYLVGVVVFTLASIAAGAAPNLELLIAARSLQGIGGALLIPGSLAIISALWTGDARGVAIGTWAGFTSITSSIGPPLGGFLVEQFSWRAVFLINVPIAIVVVIVCIAAVPENRDPHATGPIDWPGAVLVTIALGAAVFGFTEAAASGWTDALTLLALAISVAAGAAFVVVELRTPEPMVELSLFRSSTFTGANLLTLLLYAALAAGLYYLPFNLVQVQGYSATVAGAAVLPFSLIMFVGSRWAGGLIGQFGARLPLVVGPAIVGVSFLLFAVPGVGGSYWTTVFPAAVVLGIGMTITVAPLTTTVMNAVDERHSGLASGINNAVSRAGGVLAIAAFSIVMLGAFSSSLNPRLDDANFPPEARAEMAATEDQLAAMPTPASLDADQRTIFREAVDWSFIDGYRAVMIGCALISFLGAAIAAVTIREREASEGAAREFGEMPRPCPISQPG